MEPFYRSELDLYQRIYLYFVYFWLLSVGVEKKQHKNDGGGGENGGGDSSYRFDEGWWGGGGEKEGEGGVKVWAYFIGGHDTWRNLCYL